MNEKDEGVRGEKKLSKSHINLRALYIVSEAVK